MEEKKDFKTFITVNDVFRSDLEIYNENFTDEHLLLYVYMQKFNNYRGVINFCIGWLIDDLKITNARIQRNLVKSFIDLVDFKLIELISDVDKISRNTRLSVRLIKNEDKNNFTMIYDTEIEKILSLGKDIRTIKSALMVYSLIASRINNKTKYCFPSYENFKRDMQMKNENRISDTLKLLQKHKLIDYANVGIVYLNGIEEQGNNIYVLCCENDFELILQGAVAERKSSYIEKGAKVKASINGNERRKMWNLVNNRQKKYDNNELDEVGLKELLQYETERYELIKDNEYALAKQRFILFNLPTKEEPKQKTKQEIIDTETGEIKEVETDVWGESNALEDFESLKDFMQQQVEEDYIATESNNTIDDFVSMEDMKTQQQLEEVQDDKANFLYTDAEKQVHQMNHETKESSLDILKKYSKEEINNTLNELFG